MKVSNRGRWAAWFAGAALAGVALLAALTLGETPSHGVLAQSAGGCPSPSPATTATPSASAPFAVSIGGPCTGQTNIPVTFTATVQNAGTTTADLTYLWNFGDGTFGSGATVQHAYTAVSTMPYTVSVSVTGNGRSATANTTVTITQSLTVSDGGPYTGGVGQPITFTASGTALPADTVYTWDFGDGISATGKQVAHAYNTTGTFNVTLNASSASTGQVGVDKTTATIGVPSQGLSLTISGPTTATAGTAVSYFVSATGSVPADVVYTWSWGDGTANSTGQGVTHTFAAPGSYTVTVAASSASTPAATGTVTTTVTVSAPAPTATPTPSGPSVLYPTGWNIVAGATGQTFPGAAGPLYTFQTGDTNYETLPQGSPISAGRGYWAFFNGPTNVALIASSQSSITVNAPAGQFIMVGNPSQTQTMTVRGADVVYLFDPTANNYVASTVLPPGKGAWVFSEAGATITISP